MTVSRSGSARPFRLGVWLAGFLPVCVSPRASASRLPSTLSLRGNRDSPPVIAQQATPILFSFGHRIDGTAAPFAVASANGFFRTEGVSVRMDQAKGSEDAIKRVAGGERDMALVDMTVLTRFREQADAAPVKAVLHGLQPHALMRSVARKSRGIADLADLAGKKLGITRCRSSGAADRPAFARLNGLDPAKVATDRISAAVREPMLAAGQIDAVTGLLLLHRGRSQGSRRARLRSSGHALCRPRQRALRPRHHRQSRSSPPISRSSSAPSCAASPTD